MARSNARRRQQFEAPIPDRGSSSKTEVVVQRGNVHPVLKLLLFFCMATPTLGCIIMSMGAWRVHGDALDGALTAFVIVTGLIGNISILLLDKVD